MELFLPIITLKELLPLLATIAAILVISTKNAIISVFYLIVLYILVAFYLIYIGMTYLGLSYLIVYIGAIAILFLFIIMMIDIEVVEKRNNNYLLLLFLLLSGFLLTLKKILYNIGLLKMKSILYKEEISINNEFNLLFDTIKESNNLNLKDKEIKSDKLIKFENELIKLNENMDEDLSSLWEESINKDKFWEEFINEDKLFVNNHDIINNSIDQIILKESSYDINYNDIFNFDSGLIQKQNYLLIVPD